MIDKASFFAALRPQAQPFDMKGLGTVYIAQLTVGEVDGLREFVASRAPAVETDKPKSYAFGLCLVSACVQDANGVKLLDNADIDQLVASEQSAVEALVTQCLIVNKFIDGPAEKN